MSLQERHVVLGIAEMLSSVTEVKTEAQLARIEVLAELTSHRVPAYLQAPVIKGLDHAAVFVALSEQPGACALVEKMHRNIRLLKGEPESDASQKPPEPAGTQAERGIYRRGGEAIGALSSAFQST